MSTSPLAVPASTRPPGLEMRRTPEMALTSTSPWTFETVTLPDADFSVGAAGNVHVAGGIRDFKANRTGHVIVAIKSAANRRPRIAADQDNDGRKEHEQ